jgi:hypothetical protein
MAALRPEDAAACGPKVSGKSPPGWSSGHVEKMKLPSHLVLINLHLEDNQKTEEEQTFLLAKYPSAQIEYQPWKPPHRQYHHHDGCKSGERKPKLVDLHFESAKRAYSLGI